MDELKLSMRRILKRPGASIASAATLACGIAAGAATWSLMNQVLLHPLAIDRPDRLVIVGVQYLSRDSAAPPITSNAHLYTRIQAVRESGVFERVAAGGAPGTTWTQLIATDGSLQERGVYYVSYDYFDVVGIGLAKGPGFRREDDARGAVPAAVISDRLWRNEFRSDANVIGRTLKVEGKSATIVGVTPHGFRGLNLSESPDVFLPLHIVADITGPGMNYFAEPIGASMGSPTAWITIVGRLQQGMDAGQSAGRLDAVMNQSGGSRISKYVLTDANTAAIPEAARAGMARFSQLLTIAVGLLVLIGCLTVGMLLLVRTEARRGEFAMCLALGATRGRLARGVAIEGALLSVAGAVGSLPVVSWLFAGVRSSQLPGGVNIDALDLAIDGHALSAAIALAVAATLLIALVAGAFGFSTNIGEFLGSRTGVTPRLTRRRTRAALVTAQVAVSLVLLSGAGLFARSLIAALTLNAGYDTGRIATGGISLGSLGYDSARATTFFRDLRDRLSASPTVKSVAMMQGQGGMSPSGKVTVDGVPRQFSSTVWYTAVDDRFFATLGLTIRRGRDFASTDASGGPPVVIVSESFGRVLAEGGDPIGHHIRASSSRPGQPPPEFEIVGVVPDVVTRVTVLEPLVMYFPMAQVDAFPSRTVVVRAAADMPTAIQDTVSLVRQMEPAVVPTPFLTMDEWIGRQMGPQKLGVLVLAALGIIAVLLTVFGTYVMAESMASARKRELGIRAALGATRRQLGSLVMSETVRLVVLGLTVGLAVSWMLASLIRAFLFKVEPFDPLTLSVVSGVILALALAISLQPAFSAARVDLARVLRED